MASVVPNSENTQFKTGEEQAKIARQGGIASGEAKRRKKMIKENIELLLSLPLKNANAKKQLKELGIPEDEMTNQMAMVIKMYQTVLSGGKNCVSAFNSLRDTIGEKPKEVIEHSGEVNNPYSKLSEEELRKLADNKE